jgi:hypothetical protein
MQGGKSVESYSTNGAHLLNAWLWDKLQDFQWDGTDYAFGAYGTGKIEAVPIIPAHMEPEFTNIASGEPFIVYNYKTTPDSEWWVTRESNAYMIYDNNGKRCRAIMNYMIDLLKRFDWTAQNINDSLTNSAFEFKTVWVSSSTGPQDVSDEGGRLTAIVVVTYRYTVDLDGAEGSGLRA